MTTAIVIHQNILDRFAALAKNSRLAHAYLFIGPAGVGKFETALEVAKLLNCTSSSGQDVALPCHECPSCRKIEAGNHVDVRVISCTPEEAIKIDNVREMIAQVQLRPFEAQHKIFIIKNAENLTTEAGNALLKTLEEPSATSLILLTTAALSNVLGTIRSRCQPVHFFPASRTRLAKYLQKDYDIPDDAAQFLSAYSEGCLGQARQLKESDFFRRKNEIIDQMVFAPSSDAYIKKITAEKDQVREVLFVLLSWFKDVLLLKQGLDPESAVHADRSDDLRRLTAVYTDKELGKVIDQIVKTIQLHKDNLNVKIALVLLKETIWVKPLR